MATTLQDLRESAQELSDMENTDFVAESVWNRWVRFGVTQVHRAMTNFFADTYFRNQPFTIAAGNWIYALPADFLRVKGVDANPLTPRRRTVRRFSFGNRNESARGTYTAADAYCPVRKYSIIGSNLLQIQPKESAPGDYAVYYVPRPVVLTTDGMFLDDELEPYAEYIALEAAVKALVKEESYDQANLLKAQIKIIREDMEAGVEVDESPATVVNVNPGRAR